MRKKIIYFSMILIIIIFVYIIFITKIMFNNNINQYLNNFGIVQEEVIDKKIKRNSKQGGYIADIKLNKDENFIYQFSINGYNPINYLNHKKINISIYDRNNIECSLSEINDKPMYFQDKCKE